jgi:hypothetical protein
MIDKNIKLYLLMVIIQFKAKVFAIISAPIWSTFAGLLLLPDGQVWKFEFK